MDRDALVLANFAVVDVETTGLNHARDAVVEVACLRVERGTIVRRLVSLVDPGRPIPARASAVHGIFARDVRGAPTLAQLRGGLLDLARDAVIVAHNARFDVGFLPFLRARPALCTMRLARHLVDAPSYRNEALREWFGIASPPGSGPAHRAGRDAAVTAAILERLLCRYARGPFPQTVSGLLETIARPAKLSA